MTNITIERHETWGDDYYDNIPYISYRLTINGVRDEIRYDSFSEINNCLDSIEGPKNITLVDYEEPKEEPILNNDSSKGLLLNRYQNDFWTRYFLDCIDQGIRDTSVFKSKIVKDVLGTNKP